jgi:hypothetical protein
MDEVVMATGAGASVSGHGETRPIVVGRALSSSSLRRHFKMAAVLLLRAGKSIAAAERTAVAVAVTASGGKDEQREESEEIGYIQQNTKWMHVLATHGIHRWLGDSARAFVAGGV